MMEYTPGPWEVNPEDPYDIISIDWGGIAIVPNEPAENKALMKMQRANARLIAAAPDLYAACKKQQKLIEDMSRFVGQMTLKSYQLFNEAPIIAARAIRKVNDK